MRIHLILITALLMVSTPGNQATITMNLTPNLVNIRETTTQPTTLAMGQCQPSDPADICICNIYLRTVVSITPFRILKVANTNDLHVDFIGEAAGGKLSYITTPYYLLNVTCSDLTPNSTQFIYLEVYVTQNRPPIFSKKSDTANVNVPAKNGAYVYSATASDADKDPLSYRIVSTTPNVDYFSINKVTGVVSVSTSTDLYTATESSVNVEVEVSDGHGLSDNCLLTVTISNLNQRPDIMNLPTTRHLLETAKIGTTVISLVINDVGVPAAIMPPVCQVSPANERSKFDFSIGAPDTYNIKLASTLDYETTNFYTISCEISDGYLTSTGEVLKLFVDDVNEPPKFDNDAYYCNLEESDAGGSSCSLGLHDILSDPEGDLIPSVSFLVGNNSNRFRYDKTSTRITFNVDYDVDNLVMPTNVVLQLQATDIQGASSQVPVYLKINDANDNTCYFKSGNIQSKTIDQSTPLGRVGWLNAADDDLTSPNNQITYEQLQGLPPESTNYISAYSDGTIAYTSLIPASSGPVSYGLLVRCKDGGVPRRSAEATFILTYTPTTTTSTTTTTTTTTTTPTTTTTLTTTAAADTDLWDKPAFVGVFAALMGLLVLSLLALACSLFKFCGSLSLFSLGEGTGFQEVCCPKPKKVEPTDYYIVERNRTNTDYRDDYWRKGDKFETGKDDEVQNPFESSDARFAKQAPPSSYKF